MKIRKKWLSFLLIGTFVFGSLSLAGCSDAGIVQQSTGEEASTENSEKESIEMWVFFDENTPGTYYLDLWEELGDKYGYDIDIKAYSTQQIQDKEKIALVTSELPDIFGVWGGSYPYYLFDAGFCLPLNEYLEESDITFKDSYVKTYTDGNNYIIPCLVEAYGVTYCNQNLMQEMNLTMPQTWDELLTFVDQVNTYNEEHGTDYAAIELGEKNYWLGELLYETIVERIDHEAFERMAAGECDFTDEVFKEAADKIKTLVDMGAFNENFLETGEVEAVQNFVEGKAVLFPHQSTIVYHLLKYMGNDAITMEQFPCCSDTFDPDYAKYNLDINHTQTPGLCINSQAEDADKLVEMCIEFAELVNEHNVVEYNYYDMVEDSGLVTEAGETEAVSQFHEIAEESLDISPLWYAVMEPSDGDVFRNLLKKYLGNAIDRDTFIESAAEYMSFEYFTDENPQ